MWFYVVAYFICKNKKNLDRVSLFAAKSISFCFAFLFADAVVRKDIVKHGLRGETKIVAKDEVHGSYGGA